MDDSCAVCAGPLEWVAYGPCGHRDVCSTCIIRLRFVCNDRCCCICKSESNFIFVTKAMGDYTSMISDFSALSADPIEGQVGQYWFHEGTKAYFDDFNHYKMINAMCKLSCNVCDKKNEQRNGGSKRPGDFNSIEQLKFHLFHQHRLFMCSLCLEGRKIFISEQKLYNKAQLNQHVKTGDSVVDGSEGERGGFTGHPTCEFCQNPFYGDNELYLHMSTEHFTCHICQRQHPGQYEYYNDYDDLEMHFRQEHFLCEDEACLAKKFIVFPTESEIKRHDAMEHRGRMSRSKRNAALEIPTSFRYQRRAEHDQRGRGRGRIFNTSDIQLSMAIQDSLETFNSVRVHAISSNAQSISSCRKTSEKASAANPFELLATTDPEPSSRCRQNSSSTVLEESSFPPLPMAPSSSSQRSRDAVGSSENTLAARLRHRNTVKILSSSRASPAASRRTNSSANISCQSRPIFDSGHLSSSSSLNVSWDKRATNDNAPSSTAKSIQSGTSTTNDLVSSVNLASTSSTQSRTSKVTHSSSAPNLVKRETFDKISDAKVEKASTGGHLQLKVEDVQSANKALVQKIRAALEFDEDKFAAFKVISVEYRQDLIGSAEYLAYVHQFGLSHLVLDLAILCPNAQKQRDLIEIHKYNTKMNGSNENGLSINNSQPQSKKSTRKGKEKCEDNGICGSDNAVVGSLSSGIMNLQVNRKPSLEDGVFSKDKSAKGKAKVVVDEQANLNSSMEPSKENDAQSANGSSVKNVGAGGNKPRKKMSKFLKNRLGETSADALPDPSNLDIDPDVNEEKTHCKKHPPEILPAHGVWQNGGGRRLVVMSRRDRKK